MTTNELEMLRAERDFYRDLLELGTADDLESFVRRALAKVVTLAGARVALIEIRRSSQSEEGAISFRHQVGRAAGEDDGVRSEGVIADVLATCKPVHTASAWLDPRYSERGSVKDNRIEAILCVPVGMAPPVGVIYLQDREAGGPFNQDDQERVEQFARHVAPYAERLLLRRASQNDDPTRPLRNQLRAESLIGRSRALAAVLQQASLVAPHTVTALITGASGTGKTQLARVIHASGPRAAGPFVEVNCASLPETLIENELFGAVAGAHSAAHRDTKGKVAAASGGTLFLDEIAELPASAQSTLLQLVQSGNYYRLGSSKLERADVRLVVATNVDLQEAVTNKTFREDLYYRLSVLPIRMPALDERPEDIPVLARHLSEKAAVRHGLPIPSLSPAASAALQTTDWPGNVRQLANTIEAAVLRATGEGVDDLQVRHLFPARAGANESRALRTYQEQMQHYRREVVARALHDAEWNVSEAARQLDVARSYLNKLIKALDITREG